MPLLLGLLQAAADAVVIGRPELLVDPPALGDARGLLRDHERDGIPLEPRVAALAQTALLDLLVEGVGLPGVRSLELLARHVAGLDGDEAHRVIVVIVPPRSVRRVAGNPALPLQLAHGLDEIQDRVERGISVPRALEPDAAAIAAFVEAHLEAGVNDVVAVGIDDAVERAAHREVDGQDGIDDTDLVVAIEVGDGVGVRDPVPRIHVGEALRGPTPCRHGGGDRVLDQGENRALHVPDRDVTVAVNVAVGARLGRRGEDMGGDDEAEEQDDCCDKSHSSFHLPDSCISITLWRRRAEGASG